MTVGKRTAACFGLVVAVACCDGARAPSASSSTGHATSSSAGSGSSSAGTTSCTEAACQQLIECCNTGSFPDATQQQVCVAEAQDCASCADTLTVYEQSGTCKAPSSSSASSSSGGGAGAGGGSNVATSSSGSSGSSGSSTSGSSSSSSSGSCTLPDPTGKTYVGTVLLSRTTTTTSATSYGFIGDFASAPTMQPAACSGTKSGACCYETSATATAGTDSVGMLTITDGAKVLATFTAPPYDATTAMVPTLSWAAGDTLTVASNGAMIDAFDLSVVAPSVLAGVKPSFSAAVSVSKSVKLVVTWTPSAEACSQVIFSLSQAPTSSTLAHISCVVDDSAGTLTVPEVLLAKLTATTGSATIERVESTGINVANANVKMVASDTHLTSVTYTK